MGKKYLLGAIFLGLTILAANADIIPTLSNITPSAGNFQWNYATNVTVNQAVNTGDFFTIYDFGSIIPNSNTQPAGWTFSSSLTGPTPGQVAPTDNPNLLNITWTYNGTTAINGSAALGTFAVLSATNQLRTGQFAAQGTRNDGSPDNGTKISNVGTVSVPVPEMSALAPMIGVCGLGVIGLATSILRRRQTR
ncbi:MAG: hypothetical protein QOI04_880 [Verrucomicrobiota bacterium]|jgi:hypothetical protein